MKKTLNVFGILLVTMLLYTGCEKKGVLDSIVEMYDDGIETVDKAKSVDDVQKCYNEINKKVTYSSFCRLKPLSKCDKH